MAEGAKRELRRRGDVPKQELGNEGENQRPAGRLRVVLGAPVSGIAAMRARRILLTDSALVKTSATSGSRMTVIWSRQAGGEAVGTSLRIVELIFRQEIV